MTRSADEIERTLGLGARRRGRRAWAAAAVLLAVAAGGGWILLQARTAESGARYLTAEARQGDLTVTVTATGTVEPTNLVEISSELSGKIARVEVDFNDPVDVGSELARLDTSKLEAQLAVARASLDAAIARVAIAEAALQDAREKWETARDLGERGVTAQQTLTTRRAAFVEAQARLQAAIADRALAEANVDLHATDLANACICSPIKGVVLDRAVDPGQIVAAALSAPVLFTIAEDLAEMELQVSIDEADIGRVAAGQSAEFTVDAYDDRRFPAVIAEVRYAPETIDGVVTYRAILQIDNSDMLLRPGMTATAEITVAQVTDALLVPNAALRYVPPPAGTEAEEDGPSGLLGMLLPQRPDVAAKASGDTLWLIQDGLARELAVRVGDTDGDHTVILDGPVASGDRVVTGRVDG
ncbi:MAG: efflux RND transporter periplasmic adaptor subunit [Paracoccaceae bacterium]|jgi:HlyD family secretion protein|nr:efflux RND transporter periplasmic adaptor subunit [Paracoccaceae bacterium]